MRINGFTGSNQLNIANISNLLKSADIGDTLRAQITGISSKILSLRLPDGSIISAASMIPLEADLGDFLDLSVKGRDESQVFVEIVKENMGENLKADNVKDRLLSLDILPDSRSIEVGREMLKNDISLTKESFQNIIKLLSEFNNSTVDKLTFLLGNSVPVNSKNLNLLEQLSQHKQMLGQNLEDLMTQLKQLGEASAKPESEKSLDSVVNNNAQLPREKGTADNNIRAYNNINKENLSAGSINKNETKTNEMKTNQKPIGLTAEQAVIEDVQKFFTADNKVAESNTANKLVRNNVLEGANTEKELETFQSLVKNIFKVIDKASAEKLPEQLNGESTAEEIKIILRNIESAVKAVDTPEARQLLNTINEIEDSLNFINQINRFYNVVHIPININNHNSTAELYVFKDSKNKKKIDPSNTSIFVSLDTANLGLVEALINVTNKNLECHFQTHENETLQFIKSNITPLYNLLDAYGYKLVKVTYKEINQKTNLMSIKQVKNEINRRYSFDMRV